LTGGRCQSTVRATANKRWSNGVTRHSNALDLEEGVFTHGDAHAVALSLKRSAESSERRKGTPYQSAMSMLTFYINRAGKDLPEKQKTRARTRKGRIAQRVRPRLTGHRHSCAAANLAASSPL
jgi:hypothetical protein